MKQRFGSLLLSAALLAALPAAALRIGNTGHDGYPVVIPSVQKLTPVRGLFALPEALTVHAPAGFDLAPLKRWYAAERKNGKIAVGAKTPRCSFTLTGEAVRGTPEGYRLAISPEAIRVTAGDLRGLYYGMQTLCWFLRNRADENGLPCCTIEDWPDLQQRGVLWELNEVPPSKVDRLCAVLDALGAMKYNMVYADFADNFPLSISGDFNRPKGTFSRADIEKLKAAAKRNHIELVPNLQVASHTWWMGRHKEWEKLVEGKVRRDWACSYCLSNPRVDEIVHTVIRETVELLEPKRFNLNLDEIEGSPFRTCPKCKAKPPVELLMDHVRPIQKMLLDRGVTPVVAFDQFALNPYRSKHDLVPALDLMDHRVEVIDWEYTRNTSRAVFDDITGRGFKVVYMSWLQTLHNTMNLPRLAARVGALGCIVTYWLSLPATFDRFTHASVDGYPATGCQAIYSWKSSEKNFVQLPIDFHRQIRRLLDPAEVPVFRTPARPLAIDGIFNTAIGEGDRRFPRFNAASAETLAADAAGDPARFRLAVRDGKVLATVLAGDKKDGFPAEAVKIPVGTAVEGASFLLAAAPENGYKLPRRAHPVIGDLSIVYDGGKVTRIPLRYRYNIYEWNSFTGAYDARAVARVNDAEGALVNLFSLDWKNPNPKLVVKEFRFSTRCELGAAPMLFGISLYGEKKQVAGVPGKPAIRFGGTAEAVPKPSLVLADFENGLGKSRIDSTSGVFQGERSQRIVEIPGRGKVLEIKLPALKPGRHGRLTLDLPIPADAEFETLSYDVKCDNPGAILRADLYIAGDNRKANGFLNFDRGFDTEWRSVRAARTAFREKEHGGIERGGYRRIRIGFFVCNNEAPVTFWIDNVQLYREALPCRFDIREPVAEK